MFNETEKFKYYEIYAVKKPASLLAQSIKNFKMYHIYKVTKTTREVNYFDTSDQLLKSANLLLSTDHEGTKKCITLERNIEGKENEEYIKKFETFRCDKVIKTSDLPKDEVTFLSRSLLKLFTEPITVDIDDIFLRVIPTLQIKIKNEKILVAHANGSRFEVIVEDATYFNKITNRKNFVKYLYVREAEDSAHINGTFEELISLITKTNKFILEINESKYKQGMRLTKALENLNNNKNKSENI